MESQSPKKTVTSPARAETAKTPPPTSEPVIDLEEQDTSAPIRGSSWPLPLNELEKAKNKTPAKPSPKPDTRPSPKAQVLLNKEQQDKKKKQQQLAFEKQQKQPPSAAQLEKKKKTLQDKPQEPPRKPDPTPARTSGVSPLPKPSQAKPSPSPTASDKQVVATAKPPAPPTTRAHDQLSEMITRARQSGQVLQTLRTPSGDNLGSAEEFVKAWNAADLAEDFSTTSSPHPAGPSRMVQSLHSVQDSVNAAKLVFEVTFSTSTCISIMINHSTIPSPRDSGRTTDSPRSKNVIRLESLKKLIMKFAFRNKMWDFQSPSLFSSRLG